MLASPIVVTDTSRFESCRDSSDLDGKADCENGVVGELSPADVFDPALTWLGKAVLRRGGERSVLLNEVG